MNLHTEQLRQKAHELALTHEPYIKWGASKRLWRNFIADIENLRAFVRSLQGRRPSCSQPAEEWFLDHAEFIEEQGLIIQHQLTRGFCGVCRICEKAASRGYCPFVSTILTM
nr:hypothetical protein [Paenibacillus larvae]